MFHYKNPSNFAVTVFVVSEDKTHVQELVIPALGIYTLHFPGLDRYTPSVLHKVTFDGIKLPDQELIPEPVSEVVPEVVESAPVETTEPTVDDEVKTRKPKAKGAKNGTA